MGRSDSQRWVRKLADRVGRLGLPIPDRPSMVAPETKRGLPPGTVVYTGAARDEPVVIRAFDFKPGDIRELELDCAGVEQLKLGEGRVLWLDVEGVHDVQTLGRIGKRFHLHDLVVEDIASVGQRPKYEGYDDYAYIVLRMLHPGTGDEVVDEQLSMVVGRGFVLTFQERTGDVFEPIRQRLRTDRGRIREHGADYLAYRLVDVVVDSYFEILAVMDEQLDEVEGRVQEEASGSAIGEVYTLRRQLITQRRAVWPLREVVAALARDEADLLAGHLDPYLRDLQDHVARVLDLIEAMRDSADSLVELGLSIQGQRLNEVMKLLTMISTVFIPLSFIAGVYGMNFENMPELRWRWGYFVALGTMASVVCGLLIYFRRRRWI